MSIAVESLNFSKWSTGALLSARDRLEHDDCEAALEAKAAVADELDRRGYSGPDVTRREFLTDWARKWKGRRLAKEAAAREGRAAALHDRMKV